MARKKAAAKQPPQKRAASQGAKSGKSTQEPPEETAMAGRPSKKQQTEKTQERSDNAGFPIVGIGTSAGGLAALRQFLQKMPDQPGVALVVIQHLDPTRKSLVSELLAKFTRMHVCEVDDDPYVRPNRVYVIPPGKYLSISGNELHLSEPDQPRGSRMAIDFFLRSLANDQQQCAVGVVFSGSGTDGTLGIKAIKAAGGLVIAQDPTTAEFEGMPRSAIDTGVVDHILPPNKVPDVLVKYAQHSYVREGPTAIPVEEDEKEASAPAGVGAILALLRTRTKHDFHNYKEKTLVRRTRRRMCLYHLDDYDKYLKYLREHPEEVRALAKDMLISVTDFFREPEAWEELLRIAIRPMVKKKDTDEPIRVWTPGCATGEEPFSVAMLILEGLQRAEKNCPLQVFASDIDKDAIDFARAGRYPKSIEADVSHERLSQFFTGHDGGDYYHVNKLLRESVVFADQNLIGDPPFSKLDLLCCRNLLIYLKPEVQEKIIALFHFSLRENGTLFLGSAETIGRQTDLFKTLDKRWRIFRRAGPTQHDRVDIPISTLKPKGEVDVRSAPVHRREARLTQLAQQRLLDHLAPSAVLVDRDWRVLYICGDVDPYLTHKAGVPTDNLLEKARQGLRVTLRSAVPNALKEDRSVTVSTRVLRDSTYHPVLITVRTIHDRQLEEKLALVMFEEEGKDSRERQPGAALATGSRARQDETGEESADAPQVVDGEDVDLDDVIRQLESELTDVKDDLQATIEQFESSNEEYKAANEEVMSINEELQSTNEELETSKEELQSLNEELATVNNQLSAKVDELETKHADLENLVAVTDVATVCLDHNLRVRWYTPAAQKVIRLKPADKERPLADLAHDFADEDLGEVAGRVLKKLHTIEDEVTCEDGRTYIRRVAPYRTDDHRIGGVVITFVDFTERKQAEIQVSEAKEFAESVVETLHEPMLVLEPDLRVRLANAAFYKHFRVTPEETIGCLIYDLGNRQWNIPVLRELLGETLPNNKAFNDFEVRHEFESIGRRIILANGRQVERRQLILLSFRDITEQKQVEEALRDNHARLALAWEVAGGGVYEHAVPLDETTYNSPQWAEVLGYSVDELPAYDNFLDWLFERVHPEDRSAFEQAYQDFIKDRAGDYRVELRIRHRQGHWLWVQSISRALQRHSDGSVKRLIGMMLDVSDRKNVEERLAVELKAMSSLHKLINRLLVTRDLHSALEEVLTATVDIVVADMGTMQLFKRESRTLEIVAHRGFNKKFLDHFKIVEEDATSAGGRAALQGERVIIEDVQKDRQYRRHRSIAASAGYRAVQSTPMVSRQGELLGVLSTYHRKPYRPSERELRILDLYTRQAVDFVEHQQNEAILREMDQRKDEFLAVLAHELRNPLATVAITAATLAKNPSPERTQSGAKAVAQQIGHLRRIVDDLLDVTRLRQGKVKLRKKRIEIGPQMQEATETVGRLIEQRKHKLTVHPPRKPVFVQADPVRLQQILVNLLHNAAKYTDQGGEIRLSASKEKDFVVCTCRDNGRGIASGNFVHLFQPFMQIDAEFHRQDAGLGIGLAMVKDLVELHGGTVTANSPGVGKGTEFVVRLPAGRPPRKPKSEPAKSPVKKRKPKKRQVLIVEDNQYFAGALRDFLEDEGHTVRAVNNGDDAISAVRAEPPEVILLDIGLPGEDGYAVGKRIKQLQESKKIILIAMSGYDPDKRKSKGIFDSYFVKSSDPKILLDLFEKDHA